MAPKKKDKAVEMPLRNPRVHWRSIFDKYDVDKDGSISVTELNSLILSQEYDNDIPAHVVAKIHTLADTDGDGALDFDEFIKMINHPALRPIFGSMVNRYVSMVVPPKRTSLPTTRRDYADECRCCPPPIIMIVMSVVEVIFFFIDISQGMPSGLGPIADVFIYDPRRRYEAWRYLTYMFVHIGVIHLVVNVFVQILLGTPLEMVHRWWRVLIIYFAGVVAGSLGTSITDPKVRLAGASGGVYALITAHFSTIILNWGDMEYPFIQLCVFLCIVLCDVGTAIYNRHVLNLRQPIGYAAHFAGAVAGLLVGFNVLRNLNVTRTERVICWVSRITYIVLMGVAIIWNIAYPSYFPPQDYS